MRTPSWVCMKWEVDVEGEGEDENVLLKKQ